MNDVNRTRGFNRGKIHIIIWVSLKNRRLCIEREEVHIKIKLILSVHEKKMRKLLTQIGKTLLAISHALSTSAPFIAHYIYIGIKTLGTISQTCGKNQCLVAFHQQHSFVIRRAEIHNKGGKDTNVTTKQIISGLKCIIALHLLIFTFVTSSVLHFYTLVSWDLNKWENQCRYKKTVASLKWM